MITDSKSIAIVALAGAFVAGALVGSPELRAYAANTVGSIDIINNSIQSIDIKDGEVKTADIGAGAVQSSDIGNNAITSQKIKDGTITTTDDVPVLIPRPSELSIRQVEHSAPFPPNTMVGVLALCGENETAIGGGFRIDGGSATYGKITQADLSDDPWPNSGYYITGFNDGAVQGIITSIAYCGVMSLD